ncbi:hypothetical protein PCE1_000492 [Barthelona sp. PCE]
MHGQSLTNFKALLKLIEKYPGAKEMICVVPLETDPAYKPLLDLSSNSDSMSVYTSGLSHHQSQKLYQMLHGVDQSHPESEIIAFFDDDILVSDDVFKQAICRFVDDDVWMVTGYCMEVPAPDLVSHWRSAFRLINCLNFTGDSSSMAWGGCMFMRSSSFRDNEFGLREILNNGCYSDDMTMSHVATENGKKIVFDTSLFFPDFVAASLRNGVDFILRQLFVVTTHVTEYERQKNSILVVASFIPVLTSWIGGVGLIVSIYYFSGFWLILLCGSLTLLVGTVYISLSVIARMVNCFVISAWKTSVMLLFHLFLLPILMAKSVLRRSIVWSGITYNMKNGKVYSVEH